MGIPILEELCKKPLFILFFRGIFFLFFGYGFFLNSEGTKLAEMVGM